MESTISVLVENHSGVLAHISGLFSARGFNISSLTVGETDDPTVSRMTIVVEGDRKIIEQVKKQLNRLIDVIKVFDLTTSPSLERELILIKINSQPGRRSEIIELCDIFRANIVDVTLKDIMVELTGDVDKIGAFLNIIKPYGIKEIVRTGKIALARGVDK